MDCEFSDELDKLDNALSRRKISWASSLLRISIASIIAFAGITLRGIISDYLHEEDEIELREGASKVRDRILDGLKFNTYYRQDLPLIHAVSKKTGVPDYVLAAMLERTYDQKYNIDVGAYYGSTFPSLLLSVHGKDVGLDKKTLSNDDEQVLTAAAWNYKELLISFGNEEDALVAYFGYRDYFGPKGREDDPFAVVGRLKRRALRVINFCKEHEELSDEDKVPFDIDESGYAYPFSLGYTRNNQWYLFRVEGALTALRLKRDGL